MRTVLGCLAAATFATAVILPAAPARARVEAVPCPVAVPTGTACGLLEVPERRGVAGSPTIKVAYAVHRSTAADRKPDPIVYTSGGPGSSSLQLTGVLSAAPFGRDRDIVVIEQRGSRYSQPHLRCPDIDRALLDSLSRPGRDSQEGRRLTEAGRACHERLTAQGIDLRGYNTAEIAADVVSLRTALGYPTWNLMGVSYSTRSMLAAAAADPTGTRALILDSFLPTRTAQYDVASTDLRRTLERVRPGLAEELLRVRDRLNGRPVAVPITDPLTRGRRTLHLTGDDIASLLAEGMQDADLVTAVPPLLRALAEGRDDLLRPLGQVAADSLVSHDTGVYYAVNCQDEVPFNVFPAGAVPRSFFADVDRAVCQGLDLPAGADASPATAAPVLVVGGAFDAATPFDTARAEAARSLPHATTVEFAGVAHAVFLSSRCGRETIAAFLASPDRPDRPCDPAASPYRTLRPGQRYVTGRAYQVSAHPVPGLLVPGLLTVACLGVLVLAAVRRWWLLAAAAMTGPALLVGAGWVLYDVAATNPASLIVGVPWAVAHLVVLAGAVPGLAGAVGAGLARRRAAIAPMALLVGVCVVHLGWWYTG